MEYEVRAVRLGDVLSAVVPLVEPQMAGKAHRFDVAVDEPDTRVWAHREKLEQVLLNLLSNAMKFTEPGGRVTVDVPARAVASEAPELLFLRVADTGRGIPADRLEGVFAPFVQVESGRSAYTCTAEGTGLGLAISRDLARGMGGELRARSVGGEGSAFTVALRRVVRPDDGTTTDRRERQTPRLAERRAGSPEG